MTKRQNVDLLLEAFALCDTPQKTYAKIMEMGRKQLPFTEEEKIPEHLVQGCQSELYLISEIKEGALYFRAYADALISAGLAQILIEYYNGLTCEEILKHPPDFLDELKIPGSLTPSRANGLYSVHLRMKQEAVKNLMTAQKN